MEVIIISDKEKSILRKVLMIICGLIVIFSVVMLLFGNKIRAHMVQNNTDRVMTEKVVKKKKNANYNFGAVKEVTMNDILKAHHVADKPIGKISVPSVGVKLPLFQGFNNIDMTVGACTMKANQVMGGMNNYAIAGHHMEDNNVLFGPLEKTKIGDKIYLTDEKQVYIYQIDSKKNVYESDLSVLDNIPGQRTITLVTCASGQPGVKYRTIIQGSLIQQEPYNKNLEKLFIK